MEKRTVAQALQHIINVKQTYEKHVIKSTVGAKADLEVCGIYKGLEMVLSEFERTGFIKFVDNRWELSDAIKPLYMVESTSDKTGADVTGPCLGDITTPLSDERKKLLKSFMRQNESVLYPSVANTMTGYDINSVDTDKTNHSVSENNEELSQPRISDSELYKTIEEKLKSINFEKPEIIIIIFEECKVEVTIDTSRKINDDKIPASFWWEGSKYFKRYTLFNKNNINEFILYIIDFMNECKNRELSDKAKETVGE